MPTTPKTVLPATVATGLSTPFGWPASMHYSSSNPTRRYNYTAVTPVAVCIAFHHLTRAFMIIAGTTCRRCGARRSTHCHCK